MSVLNQPYTLKRTVNFKLFNDFYSPLDLVKKEVYFWLHTRGNVFFAQIKKKKKKKM